MIVMRVARSLMVSKVVVVVVIRCGVTPAR